MFSNLIKSLGLDIPAEIIEAVGTGIQFIGELTDSETLQSIGETLQESADTISS
jgi:hypothetical protein